MAQTLFFRLNESVTKPIRCDAPYREPHLRSSGCISKKRPNSSRSTHRTPPVIMLAPDSLPSLISRYNLERGTRKYSAA